MTEEKLKKATDQELQQWLDAEQISLAYDSGAGQAHYEREIEQIEKEIKYRRNNQ